MPKGEERLPGQEGTTHGCRSPTRPNARSSLSGVRISRPLAQRQVMLGRWGRLVHLPIKRQERLGGLRELWRLETCRQLSPPLPQPQPRQWPSLRGPWPWESLLSIALQSGGDLGSSGIGLSSLFCVPRPTFGLGNLGICGLKRRIGQIAPLCGICNCRPMTSPRVGYSDATAHPRICPTRKADGDH